MSSPAYDVAVIGGGIVGLATAMALSREERCSVVVLEAESQLAAHQSGRNSGVIHAGLYYKPGSLKARNCVEGREAMYRFCDEHGIRAERCGKLVVATEERELPRLDELERRGRANGLDGLERLGPEEIREREPHAAGIAGLWVPQTGIVDYGRVTRAMADVVRQAGGEIRTGARVHGCRRLSDGMLLESVRGEISCRWLVNCAGLQSDRVARCAGVDPGVAIVPFRGEYYELAPARRALVQNLIYPVPDPAFPFLGVHFTRTSAGTVEAGPNAVLALEREGYRAADVRLRDLVEMGRFPGFWRMCRQHWRTGIVEMYRSVNRRAFVKALRKLVPEVAPDDVRYLRAGVRAQAVGPGGALLDDFHLIEAPRSVHVLNAPSPAATASITIGRTIAEMVVRRLRE
ncbi:MAG: L-2-hydroxyglutarate oxidase [Deltaproteobacteria bacterium]|nr:MAG: L-2-hydroxyglutarate oxidase [Deltaproteobacteria bacterium]